MFVLFARSKVKQKILKGGFFTLMNFRNARQKCLPENSEGGRIGGVIFSWDTNEAKG